MHRNLHATWLEKLREEFEQPYFRSLEAFVDAEYSNRSCYPAQEDIFKAFNQCHFNKIKVVIIGQDPYHGKGQANGLCFSVQEGVKHPPSLINIFKELHEDLEIPYPNSGNLEGWAKQGVLLLNATLTVGEAEAGSHQKKGWEQFTDVVINKISTEKEGIIFLLWGGYAKKKGKNIDAKKHHVLSSGHPSPLSANRGFWFGNKHFSKTNLLLKASAQAPIEW